MLCAFGHRFVKQVLKWDSLLYRAVKVHRLGKGMKMTAYEKVSRARAKGRATSVDYIEEIFDDFMEMHGDRRFGDDKSIVAGIGLLKEQPVTIIGIEKGRNVKERGMRNSGSAHPEGYRKALRQMKLAEKFKRPVVCFVDTPGAYCGVSAEERGQGQAIAENLTEMMTLKVPIISIVIGEGGSGGALALAVADEVWMLENAVYSVISPEGCASILWKEASRANEASECLKLTAQDMHKLNIIEQIIPEHDKKFTHIKSELIRVLDKNKVLTSDELTENRYARFRKIGV